ncbi:L-lactate dehydrogenase [Streptomyces alboniger]
MAGSVAAADALPRVAAAVGDRLTVLFDSGVRTGDDLFKALALGARAVLLGRPYVYGLGLDGQSGVEHVIRCLLAEFDLALALATPARRPSARRTSWRTRGDGRPGRPCQAVRSRQLDRLRRRRLGPGDLQ